MNSISEREWLKSYFNKREGRRQNEKGKKAKVKTESEADYAQDWLESHKSTGNKIIGQTCCASVKKDQGEVQLLPNSIFLPQLGKCILGE